MSSYMKAKVASYERLDEQVFVLALEGDFKAKPGQFYMLKIGETSDPLLGRPISVSDVTEDKIYFLIQIMGRGTEMLSKKKEGDFIQVLGPLGNGFEISDGKCAMLAGTAGIAPLLYLAKQLPNKPDLYAGFRSKSYYIDRFDGIAENIYVASEDGSDGHRGYALDLLNADKYDKIYICGPMPMIKATINKFPDANLEVSLEAHMGCGFGACLSCTCQTKEGSARICKDGPVFKAKELSL